MSADAGQLSGSTEFVRAARLAFDDVTGSVASWEEAAVELMLYLVEQVACARELAPERVERSRLYGLRRALPLEVARFRKVFERAFEAVDTDWARDAGVVQKLGAAYESLIASTSAGQKGLASHGSVRKRSGSFYTPTKVAARVVSEALAPMLERSDPSRWRELRVLDPAAGAGAFLLEACRELSSRVARANPMSAGEARREVALSCLYGADSNPLSVAVLELGLWLFVGDRTLGPEDLAAHLFVGDALVGYDFCDGAARGEAKARLDTLTGAGVKPEAIDWRAACPEVADRGFDVVCGNPPWVAFAGRSAQHLEKPLRTYFSESYLAWRGFPTLHGLFAERAAQLARHGTVALLLPSPVADLDGYRFVRRRLSREHRVRKDLLEFGQDAFESVTQPCFALVADADPEASESEERWTLSERQRASGVAEQVRVPQALVALKQRASRLPSEAFGEYGFQTSRVASETLLLRGEKPDRLHDCPLLEGRNVGEFSVGKPRLFLRADPDLLKKARCRLRPREQYRSVGFVVRQTAPVPIAALHTGLPFRNSLLGGFGQAELSAPLLVALLNSTLYRAWHLASQRDARQAAFPQVKLAHLRDLPAPPPDAKRWKRLEALTREMTEAGVSPEPARELDALVFALFDLGRDAQHEIHEFLKSRAPKYAR